METITINNGNYYPLKISTKKGIVIISQDNDLKAQDNIVIDNSILDLLASELLKLKK